MSCDAALGPADAAVVPLVVVGWSFQEWAIHKYLLHGLEVIFISHRALNCFLLCCAFFNNTYRPPPPVRPAG